MTKNEAEAIFAGGCFWCMQGPFDHTPGVLSTEVGYTSGQTENPTYRDVCTGMTGHTEGIRVVYDPSKVSYDTLLDVFWRNIDPTDGGGQFADRGSQYRTGIYFVNDDQKQLAEASKVALAASGKFTNPIATEIVPASTFYRAEEDHQHYYKKQVEHYQRYRQGSGRAGFLEQTWGG